MDRRSFLKNSTVGVGATAAAATLAAPAYAQGKRTLTMVTSVPEGFAIFDDAAQNFVDRVGAMTDGQLTIDKKPAGTLVGAFEVFDAVSAGQADCYHSADYYFMGQHPGFAYFTSVPFGMTGPEIMSWYYHNGGHELHSELGSIFNLKSFLCGNTGHQPGGWFNREINSAADLQGLKFRMPGFGGKALGLTGASVQALPGGEIYQALASGAIDGAEWIGPFADERLGFQEICKFYYTSGFHEPGSALTASFNLQVYESLSDQHKAVVETAAHATHSWNLAQSNARNATALGRLKAAGVKVLEFDDSIWEAFGKASKEAQDGFMDDDLFATIRNNYEESMASTYSWMSMSDGVFAQKRDKFRV